VGALLGMLLFGTVTLAPGGLTLGLLARPRAASTLASIIFLPLAYASGLFARFADLPERVQRVSPYLPTFHLGQLVWGAVAEPAAITSYLETPVRPDGIHYAWLLGTALVFTAIAAWAYRRDRRHEGE